MTMARNPCAFVDRDALYLVKSRENFRQIILRACDADNNVVSRRGERFSSNKSIPSVRLRS